MRGALQHEGYDIIWQLQNSKMHKRNEWMVGQFDIIQIQMSPKFRPN